MIGGDWWVARLLESNPILLASWVFWVIFAITLHELAHGWAAIRCGDRTPIDTGHMTWNPVVHMGVPSLIMFALVGIAWGQMPVDPTRFRGRHADAYVSFAGPMMNLSLAVTSMLLLVLWVAIAGGYWFKNVSVGDPTFGNAEIFLRVGVILNLVLFMLNMMPVPPLDGSSILVSFSPAFRRLREHENAGMFSLVGFVVLFYFGGPHIFGAAGSITRWAEDALLSVMVRP